MAYQDPLKQREYQRKWMAKRRTEFFADKTCVSCGTDQDLQLHHKDPAQKIHHRIWSWSEARRLPEIAKCEVLCGHCHREHHLAPIRHGCGSAATYKRGCRCRPCTTANTLACREKRQRRALRAAQ